MARWLHLWMALNMLLGSSGLVVSQHFCGGELKSTAFFRQAERCHQLAAAPKCPLHGSAAEEPKGCCENDTERYVADLDYVKIAAVHLPTHPISTSGYVAFPVQVLPTGISTGTFIALPPKIPPLGSGVDLCRRLARWRC
jgi:hypothetical protein